MDKLCLKCEIVILHLLAAQVMSHGSKRVDVMSEGIALVLWWLSNSLRLGELFYTR